jgi:ribonuclease H-related protein
MNYLYHDKTISRARAFSDYLNQFEFQALIDLDATRDYLAKIDIHAAGLYIGKLGIYYSPKKDAYTLSCQSISVPAYHEVLKEKWYDFLHDRSPAARHRGISAYVDGSFINGRIGYGAVLVENNRCIHEIRGSLDDRYQAHRQIGGELKAVLEALRWCAKQKIGEIHIYYDYKGIEMWARGKWKAKTELTQKYQAFMIRQYILIHFHKVAAHSGDRWNEYADRLAKEGAMQETKTEVKDCGNS